MDALIRKIEKEVPKKSKAHKELKHLEKEDKKQDKKMMKCNDAMRKKVMKKNHK